MQHSLRLRHLTGKVHTMTNDINMESKQAKASEYIAIGEAQFFQAEKALLISAVAMAMGRIAAVQGWGGADKVKAAEYDDHALDGIQTSRAKFYRIKAAMVKGSARIAKELKNTLEKASHEDAETAVSLMVSALEKEGVTGFMAFYDWAQNKADNAPKEKPTLDDQLRAIFCGTEKNPEGKISEISAETLDEIAKAVSVERSKRKAAAKQAEYESAAPQVKAG